MSIDSKKVRGKYQYRYHFRAKDENGQPKQYASKWYNTAAEARKAEKEFREILARRLSNHTFEKIANEYIEASAEKNVKKTTDQKRYILKTYYKDIAHLSIEEITPKMVKDCLARHPLLNTQATTTKNRVRTFANSVFRYAELYYDLPTNPMHGVPTYTKTTAERLQEMTIYTKEQFEQFIAQVPDERMEYKALFYVIYWTGMRLNEANSLTFNDVTPKKIHLYRQYVDGEFRTLKTIGSTRDIAIDPTTYAYIQAMREKWSCYDGFSNTWFIFGGFHQLAEMTITRVKNRAVKQAGLPPVRIHDFRHSHASNLIEAGVNIYKISKRLGHSSISITLDRYGHLIDTEGDEIIEAIKTM